MALRFQISLKRRKVSTWDGLRCHGVAKQKQTNMMIINPKISDLEEI